MKIISYCFSGPYPTKWGLIIPNAHALRVAAYNFTTSRRLDGNLIWEFYCWWYSRHHTALGSPAWKSRCVSIINVLYIYILKTSLFFSLAYYNYYLIKFNIHQEKNDIIQILFVT